MYADAATRFSWSPKSCHLNPYILCRRRYPSKAYTGVGNTWSVDRAKRRQHGSMMTTTATLPRQPEMLHRRPIPISRTINEKNRLLAALPVEEYWRLAPHFEVVKLEARQVLASPEQPMHHVFFP